MYIFLYGALGIIKSMQYSYLSASVATLEKKFGIKSKETAFLMSGNELAQILFLFALPITVKARKRPLWCGIGLSISALGLYLMALPHFITGYASIPTLDLSNATLSTETDLCDSEVHLNSLSGNCNDDGSRRVDWVGLVFVFIGIGLTGIGNCLFYSFGVVYLDDNSGKENSPFMLGLTFTFRLIGPTLGYLLGGSCLTTYVHPNEDPGYDETDPRWIGAWWIGFPVIATLLLLFSIPLMLFPVRLPKADSDAAQESAALKNLTRKEAMKRNNFKDSFMRLLTNKLYIWNFFSSIFVVFAFMGFGTFMPKYIEFQFRQTGSRSSIYAGTFSTGSKAIGLIISGYLIGRFKFSARTLSGWNVFLGVCYITLVLYFSMVGCPTSQMYGEVSPTGGDYIIQGSCNIDCGCPTSRPQPICSKDGVTNFYSPCHAGCVDVFKSNGSKIYQNCSCVLEASEKFNTSLSKSWIEKEKLGDLDHPAISLIDTVHQKYMGQPVDEAEPGWCKVEGCSTQFMYFMIAAGVVSIVASTGRVGNLLVALRCVEVRDKALSMAFQVVFMSLFAMLPSPIVYGAIIDNTCILWQKECGETTNCLLYDTDSLRQVLMLTTAAIASLGVLCDVMVWYYSKDLEIFYSAPLKPLTRDSDADGLTAHASTISLAKEPAFK